MTDRLTRSHLLAILDECGCGISETTFRNWQRAYPELAPSHPDDSRGQWTHADVAKWRQVWAEVRLSPRNRRTCRIIKERGVSK